ncbi:MAG: hypothetical protein O2819_08040 [Planctomycetota bacterium]|nr:hypothetical protein [Planctomycetota bacterium]MDA1106084.1 hypothetical protein [Planctomycetota bacterium]
MRTIRTIAITACACLFLAACGDGTPSMTKVEKRPEPTTKIQSPEAKFNSGAAMQSTTNQAAPPSKRKN